MINTLPQVIPQTILRLWPFILWEKEKSHQGYTENLISTQVLSFHNSIFWQRWGWATFSTLSHFRFLPNPKEMSPQRSPPENAPSAFLRSVLLFSCSFVQRTTALPSRPPNSVSLKGPLTYHHYLWEHPGGYYVPLAPATLAVRLKRQGIHNQTIGSVFIEKNEKGYLNWDCPMCFLRLVRLTVNILCSFSPNDILAKRRFPFLTRLCCWIPLIIPIRDTSPQPPWKQST